MPAGNARPAAMIASPPQAVLPQPEAPSAPVLQASSQGTRAPQASSEVARPEAAAHLRVPEPGVVQASVRDAEGLPAESRQRAMSLASALLAAGFDRVRVYVNGWFQSFDRTRTKEASDSAARASMHRDAHARPTIPSSHQE